MGAVAGSQTEQWFLEVKATVLKRYPKFVKIIGGAKKNQSQPKQRGITYERISPKDFKIIG